MLTVVTLLFIVVVSILIARVAAVALTLTGMSDTAARFQARSALTGTGFTTREAEQIMSHPVRRQIVGVLMILGSAGVVTTITTLTVGLSSSGTSRELGVRLGGSAAGLIAIWWVTSRPWFDRWLSPVLRRLLARFTDLDVRDYASLLNVHGNFSVFELAVPPGCVLDGARLVDAGLVERGVLVLAVRRTGGGFDGAPGGATRLLAGDTLTVYGSRTALRALEDELHPE